MKKSSTKSDQQKILLALLPVWDPLIPPLGISCLKSFLQQHGYDVRTVDANIEDELRNVTNKYFARLNKYVPDHKRRHLSNIGHEVLKNHMMVHLNYKCEREYVRLVKILIFQTFFCDIDDLQVYELNQIMVDLYLNLERYFINLLQKEKPTVLGLSVYGGTLAASMFVFKLVKEKYPHIQTVMGGGIFSGELSIYSPDFEFFLEKTPYIDQIIVGEGEHLFLNLLRGKLPQNQRVYTLNDINGKILDISSIDVPDFSDFDLQYYVQMASYTSRSCPFRCNFCVERTYWGNFRKKAAQQIANELVKLYKKTNNRLFLMCDSLLNPIISELAGEFVKVDIPIYWGGYLRVDEHACNIETTMRWRQGGFYRARLGVESGSQRILDLMDKGLNLDQAKAAISGLAYSGIKTTVMFVIGYPGETEQDFQCTLDLVEELKDDIYEADCNPFWYFFSGQKNSEKWRQNNRVTLLYPEEAKEMLIVQTWTLGEKPSRQETYERVNRFVEHCIKLRIPNPYSLQDAEIADDRWKRLHQNAVPSLLELKSNKVGFKEAKNVRELQTAVNTIPFSRDWNC